MYICKYGHCTRIVDYHHHHQQHIRVTKAHYAKIKPLNCDFACSLNLCLEIIASLLLQAADFLWAGVLDLRDLLAIATESE